MSVFPNLFLELDRIQRYVRAYFTVSRLTVDFLRDFRMDRHRRHKYYASALKVLTTNRPGVT